MTDFTAGGLTLYEIIWFFLIYSFLGWVLEVVYHAASQGTVVNRGFLNGPVCPIYGFGMIIIILLLNTLFPEGAAGVHGALLFLFGLVLATVVELFGGWALDRVFHARWWDYSDRPFNLNGYICPEFSLYWGLGTVFAIRILHPFVKSHTVDVWPERFGYPAAALLLLIYAADFAVTVMIVNGINRKLAELDTLQASMRVVSDDLSTALGTGSIRTVQRIEEGKARAALAKERLHEETEDLRKRLEEKRAEITGREQALYDDLLKGRVFGARRLLEAFPDLKMRDHSEVFSALKEKLKIIK